MSKLEDTYSHQIYKAIKNYGRNVTIYYAATSNCSSCAYDPINKTATNSFCSTCNGQYFFDKLSTARVKGVIKTFVGDMKFQDYALHKFGYVPGHDARLTCWLEDVLVNQCSATGTSYLDNPKNVRIEADGSKYTIDSTQRVGFDTLKVIIATLKAIK